MINLVGNQAPSWLFAPCSSRPSCIGAVYNEAVDRYGDYRLSRFASVPLLVADDGDAIAAIAVKSADELRRTVSRRTGLVGNLDDRRSWNLWLTEKTTDDAVVVRPGNYTFMYRSYVNFEEANCIKKSLFHIKTWWGFTNVGRGVMTISPSRSEATDKDSGSGGIMGDKGGRRAVVLRERFRSKLFNPMTITWNGVLTNNRIDWTDTELKTGRGDGATVIKNPPAAERLRQIPWEIVKEEDEMVAFKREGHGLLAYDLKS